MRLLPRNGIAVSAGARRSFRGGRAVSAAARTERSGSAIAARFRRRPGQGNAAAAIQSIPAARARGSSRPARSLVPGQSSPFPATGGSLFTGSGRAAGAAAAGRTAAAPCARNSLPIRDQAEKGWRRHQGRQRPQGGARGDLRAVQQVRRLGRQDGEVSGDQPEGLRRAAGCHQAGQDQHARIDADPQASLHRGAGAAGPEPERCARRADPCRTRSRSPGAAPSTR